MNNKNTPVITPEHEKHYSDSNFWDKVKSVAKKAGEELIYNALLLYYVLQSPSTPKAQKTLIIGALGYFILPVDLIPDAIPTAGFTDDLAALGAIISALASCITLEMQNESKQKCHELLGDIDDRAIDGITKIIDNAHKKINKSVCHVLSVNGQW